MCREKGAIAQLGERLLCKQEVIGSIPIGSTSPGLRPLPAETSNPTVLFVALLRVHTLFKNPEVLFLTLIFQANDFVLLKMSRSHNVNQLKR